MNIEIRNLTRKKIDEKLLKKLAKKVLKEENVKEGYLSIAFVGETRIRKINKQYRQQDKPTDVLSFEDDWGEIIICLEQVKKNGKKYQVTFKKELARVLIHGILHLLSYKHSKKMQEKEQEYIN